MRYSVLSPLVVFVILLVGSGSLVRHATAQLSPADIQALFDNTGIVPTPFCNPGTNQYSMQLQNSLPYNYDATLTLACVGCSNYTIQVALGASSLSSVVTMTSPSSCQVANRLCEVVMIVPDLLTSSTTTYRQVAAIPSTCGVVPPDDYDPNCDWVNYPCQVTNGEWYHYGPFLLTINAGEVVVLVFIDIIVIILWETSRQVRLKRIDMKRLPPSQPYVDFAQGFNAGFLTGNTGAPLPNRPSGIGYFVPGRTPGMAQPPTPQQKPLAPSAGVPAHVIARTAGQATPLPSVHSANNSLRQRSVGGSSINNTTNANGSVGNSGSTPTNKPLVYLGGGGGGSSS